MAFGMRPVADGQRYSIVVLATMLASLSLCSPTSAAGGACDGVETTLTDARKHEYSALVAGSLTASVKPSSVKIRNFMAAGSWSAVYASTPVSEDGVLFFDTVSGKKQFKDDWGGWATPDDRPELIRWAKALGVPESLARCFAHIIID